MFSAFSWVEFAQGTLVVLLCYYAAVGMIFYRHELTRLVLSFTLHGAVDKDKDVSRSRGYLEKQNADKEEAIVAVKEDEKHAIQTKSVEDLSRVYVELEEAIEVDKVKNKSRSELLDSLKTIVEKYKNSIDKDVAATIRVHIQSQLAVYSWQQFTDEELQQLWPTLNK